MSENFKKRRMMATQGDTNHALPENSSYDNNYNYQYFQPELLQFTHFTLQPNFAFNSNPPFPVGSNSYPNPNFYCEPRVIPTCPQWTDCQQTTPDPYDTVNSLQSESAFTAQKSDKPSEKLQVDLNSLKYSNPDRDEDRHPPLRFSASKENFPSELDHSSNKQISSYKDKLQKQPLDYHHPTTLPQQPFFHNPDLQFYQTALLPYHFNTQSNLGLPQNQTSQPQVNSNQLQNHPNQLQSHQNKSQTHPDQPEPASEGPYMHTYLQPRCHPSIYYQQNFASHANAPALRFRPSVDFPDSSNWNRNNSTTILAGNNTSQSNGYKGFKIPANKARNIVYGLCPIPQHLILEQNRNRITRSMTNPNYECIQRSLGPAASYQQMRQSTEIGFPIAATNNYGVSSLGPNSSEYASGSNGISSIPGTNRKSSLAVQNAELSYVVGTNGAMSKTMIPDENMNGTMVPNGQVNEIMVPNGSINGTMIPSETMTVVGPNPIPLVSDLNSTASLTIQGTAVSGLEFPNGKRGTQSGIEIIPISDSNGAPSTFNSDQNSKTRSNWIQIPYSINSNGQPCVVGSTGNPYSTNPYAPSCIPHVTEKNPVPGAAQPMTQNALEEQKEVKDPPHISFKAATVLSCFVIAFCGGLLWGVLAFAFAVEGRRLYRNGETRKALKWKTISFSLSAVGIICGVIGLMLIGVCKGIYNI